MFKWKRQIKIVAEYYFDIETCTKDEKPNPRKDKIITIQFQKLDRNGEPVEELQILKEWEKSEREILQEFLSIFDSGFKFIPVGANLGYDFIVIYNRAKKLLKPKDLSLEFLLHEKPKIDLKYTCILLNDGKFIGWSDVLGKRGDNKNIKEWYKKREYDKIEEYIVAEAKDFIEFYKNIKNHILQYKQ